MAEKTDAPTRTAERELVITRAFDVPRELVWKAWTARDHVLKWLGPKDFTAVDFELEPRPGGAWHSRIRGPDGAEYSNGGTVREVHEPAGSCSRSPGMGKMARRDARCILRSP